MHDVGDAVCKHSSLRRHPSYTAHVKQDMVFLSCRQFCVRVLPIVSLTHKDGFCRVFLHGCRLI